MAQHTVSELLLYSTPREPLSEAPTAPSATAGTPAVRQAAEPALEAALAAQAQRSPAAEADHDRAEADEFTIAEGFVTEALARTAEEAEMLDGDHQEVRKSWRVLCITITETSTRGEHIIEGSRVENQLLCVAHRVSMVPIWDVSTSQLLALTITLPAGGRVGKAADVRR